MKSEYQNSLNHHGTPSHGNHMSNHNILNILQGLPARLDFLKCELLVAYNDGVEAFSGTDISTPKLDYHFVLQRLQNSLHRLLKYLDVDSDCQEDNVLSVVHSLLHDCIPEVTNEVLIPLGMLVLFVAICSIDGGQDAAAIALLQKFLATLESVKEQNLEAQFFIWCNEKKYELMLTPDPDSESKKDGVLSLTSLIHILMAYLCLGQRDMKRCESHLEKVNTTMSLTDEDPHLTYMRAFLHFKKSEMAETRLLLENWKKQTYHSGNCSPQLWNMCGCLFGNLGKPNTAIQMYKEALKLDFDFVLPMYNIAQQYQTLGLYDAELEILNLLLTTLEQQAAKKEDLPTIHTKAVVANNTTTMICNLERPTISVEQALYFLCRRCFDLSRYEIAGQKYMNLLALLTDHSRSWDIPDSHITLPPVSQIFLECAQCLLYSQQYKQCIIICDRLIERCPLTIHVDHTKHQESPQQTVLKRRSDPNSLRKKRLHSEDADLEESSLCNRNRISIGVLAYMCKVDALLRLGQEEEACLCLARVIEVLEEQHIECLDDKDVDDTKPATKRARLDSGSTSAKYSRSPSRCEVTCTLTEAYSKKSIIHLGLQQNDQALIYSRKALTNSKGDLTYTYNHTLILLAAGRCKEAYTAWLNHRGISTPLDPFQAENILKRKRTAFECSKSETECVDDELLLSGLEETQLLNLDILSLSNILESRQSKH